MPTPVSAARQCLTEEAARALDDAVAVARRRSHAQTTSLHAVSALLALPSSSLREACARARSSAYSPRLQFRALELSVGVSLDRLPSSKSVEEPPVSNSLMAAIKRSQANQRRHPDNFHYQIIQSQTQQQQQTTSLLKVELKHFILSILDDPIVSRVFGEAGFRSTDIKLAIIHPPVSRFARTRCPPVFLCNLTDPDLTQRRSSFGFPGMEDENSRRIAEVLVRKSGKRNPLLLGVCAMDALRSFTERVKSGGENVLPSELSGVSVICIGNEISEFVNGGGSEEKMGLKLKEVGELQCLDERGGKVVVNFGDLKALVEDNDDSSEGGVSFVVSRLSQLVELHGERLWLMGAAGSYETYSKFLGKFPSIEKDWDLNLLPITSSNKPSGDVFPYKSSYPTSFTKMGYIWNLVKGDIKRLTFLFSALSEIFGKCDELRKKLVELKDLLTILAEMVGNSEKQYKVDDEEKQDEGSVLDDEEKQHERSVLELKKHERIVLELWLEELQDAVFNMEDLVDKIHTEALRHKLDGQICEKMEDIRCSLESYVKQGDVLGLAGLRYNLECLLNLQGMHHLDKYLLDLNNRMGSFNDSDDWVVSLWERRLDPTDYIYFVDESEVFGMDCDKEEIIKLLLSDDASDRQLSVISIEGNGRIGKTTLARLVYNEQRVTHHFHLKAWVRVPFDFDWVTRSILKFLTLQGMDIKVPNSLYYYLNDLDKLNSDELGHRLQQCLKGKRFLLVLDGAKWTPNSKRWEALRFALKDAANGSCIIVTTRNKDIAPMMDAVSTFRMEPLSEEKCWPIFAKFAFGDQNPSSDTRLEVIGKEIVQMCHGLPSSVRILGSLLRFKLQQEKWEAILQRLKPSSDSREDSRENVNVVPNLKLPEDLKLCLAYCSIFPQDYEIEKEKLVLLCMAEGFLKPAPIGKTLKEDSENIDKLKSFFPKSSRNESSFRMCMNNLAAYVSTRYCFRLEDNHPSQIPLNTRYLSLVGGKYENSVIFEAIDRAKLLRTFLPLDHESRHLCATELQNLLSKVQFLRVLSLSHYHITEIPDSIGNLEHLRYIDLSHTPIKRLPESVCVLCNLLSLILSNCHSLTELPENTSNLVNLLNLDISGSGLSEMPIGISNLKNLRFLPCFVVGKKSGSLIELKNITRLEGTLHISKLQNVTSENDAGGTPLVGMHFLEELVLDWDDNTADPENARKVLAALKPYPTLERLTINFYCGPKFPKWLDGTETFNEMVFLRLSNCKNCSTLPPLGNLPYLRVLIIECMDAVEEVGPDFSAETSTRKNTEFKSLERLTFEGMSKWTKWVPLDELPCLNQLCIRRCPKLRGNLPNLLPSVERVEISESQELVTALTTEESLKNLRYRDRIVSISSDGKETYFKSERATGSSSLIIEGILFEKCFCWLVNWSYFIFYKML